MLTDILLHLRSVSDLGGIATAITALLWVLGFMLVEEVRMHDIEPRD